MKRLSFSLACLLGLLLLATPIQVSAASNSLGVNPRRDYTIKPGDKVDDTLFVSNLNKSEALDITISTVDFGPKGESGTPALLLDRKDPTKWSLKQYIKIAPTIRIPAGKSQEVPFTISIPKGTGAGSYYSAVKYSTTGENTPGNNVSLTSSSATLVFVRVSGQSNDALLLKGFGPFTPTKDGASGSFGSFYGGGAPKYISYRVENKGNVAEQPNGSVVIKNIFGRQTKLFEKANPNNNVVLLGQTRRFDLCINEEKVRRADPDTNREIEESKCNNANLAPGRYTAQMTLVYGDDGGKVGGTSHELRASTSFWYLPMWFVLVSLVVLLGIIGILWLIIRTIRGNRRRFNGRR